MIVNKSIHRVSLALILGTYFSILFPISMLSATISICESCHCDIHGGFAEAAYIAFSILIRFNE